MFQNLPLPAAQEIRESSSTVTPCIVMKNDGVLYHQVSSFSPERWTKVVVQELAVVGSIYRLPWSYSVVRHYPIYVIRHNEHHLHSTLCRAHFLWTRRTGCFHSFDWRFKFGSYERAQASSIATNRGTKSSLSLWYRSNEACIGIGSDLDVGDL